MLPVVGVGGACGESGPLDVQTIIPARPTLCAPMRLLTYFPLLAAALVLAGCGSSPPKPQPAPAAPAPPSKPGYYKDDGPGETPPNNLDAIPDAQPKLEPLHRFANRPYTVFGREYVPATSLRPYKERGKQGWEVDIIVRLPSGETVRERVKSPVTSKSGATAWGRAREAAILPKASARRRRRRRRWRTSGPTS